MARIGQDDQFADEKFQKRPAVENGARVKRFGGHAFLATLVTGKFVLFDRIKKEPVVRQTIDHRHVSRVFAVVIMHLAFRSGLRVSRLRSDNTSCEIDHHDSGVPGSLVNACVCLQPRDSTLSI